jgi:hypothetical protein
MIAAFWWTLRRLKKMTKVRQARIMGEHTHCEVCSSNLTLADCRDLDYIELRLRQNKEELDEHGAQPMVLGQPMKFTNIELLKQAQDDEKMLLTAHDTTITLKQQGKL